MILEGASAAFARGGFAGTSMAEIARAAGITPLVLYRHFASKEALYRAVLARASSGVAAELARRPEPGGFGVGAAAVLAAARSDPAGFQLLWRHALREPVFRFYALRLRERAIGVVEGALAARVPRDALRWAAHALVGSLVEAVLNWLDFGDPRRDAEFIAATNASIRAGVRAWSKPPPR